MKTEAMEPEQMEEPASETKQEDNVAKNESEPEEPEQDKQKKRNPIAQALRTPKYSQKKMEKQETVQPEDEKWTPKTGLLQMLQK